MTREEIEKVVEEWRQLSGQDISIPIEKISDIKIFEDKNGVKYAEITYTTTYTAKKNA